MSERDVALIGAGTSDDPSRPDLPSDTSYNIVAWHDDGTVTVKVDNAYEVAELRGRIEATETEVRGMRDRAAAVETTDTEAGKVRDAISGKS